MASMGRLRLALLLLGAAAAVSLTLPAARGSAAALFGESAGAEGGGFASPQHDGDGLLLERVLKYTRRQLTTSLGGLFQMATTVSAVKQRVLRALFLRAHVADAQLAADLRAWAQEQAEEQAAARQPGVLVATSARLAPQQLARVRAACGADRTPRWVGSSLACYAPVLSGPAAATDGRNFVVLQPATEQATAVADSGTDYYSSLFDSDDDRKAPAAAAAAALRLAGGARVWLHELPDGNLEPAASGVLGGVPRPLRSLLHSAGLAEFLPDEYSSYSYRRKREAVDAASANGVYLSVLRWHGAAALAAALQGAHARAQARRAATLEVYAVVGESGWQRQPAVAARPMATVVLPKDGQRVRRQAHALMSHRYASFCQDKGIAQRAGYALWGPPGCGKTSFVSALAAELDVPLYTLSLDAERMSNAGVAALLRLAQEDERFVMLIEDVDRLLPPTEAALAAEAAAQKAAQAQAGPERDKGGSTQQMAAGSDGGCSEDDPFELDEPEPYHPLGLPPPSRFGRANKAGMKRPDALSLEGFVRALLSTDGPPSGRLLFLTTNHIDTLRSTGLLQPGLVDLPVQFTLGSVDMVRALFINFYLLDDEALEASGSVASALDADAAPRALAAATRNGTPAATVHSLASAFAERCGDQLCALAEVQGHLLEHWSDLQAAVNAVDVLVARCERSRAAAGTGGVGEPPAARPPPGGDAAQAAAAEADCVLAPMFSRLEATQSTGELLRQQTRLAPAASARSHDGDGDDGSLAARELARLANAAVPLQRTASLSAARPPPARMRLGPAASAPAANAR